MDFPHLHSLPHHMTHGSLDQQRFLHIARDHHLSWESMGGDTVEWDRYVYIDKDIDIDIRYK